MPTWAALRAGLRAEPRVALWTTLQIELRSDARRTNNRYCATAPLDLQTYNAGYIHMEIEAPRVAQKNAGCATRLRRQAKEGRLEPDPSWSR